MTYEELSKLYNEFAVVKKDAIQIRNKVAQMGWGIKNRYVYRDYFNIIDTPDKVYWLGFIYADGYISNGNRCGVLGIELNHNDIEHLHKFNICLNSSSKIALRHKHLIIANNKFPTDTFTVGVRIFSTEIVNGLLRNGIEFNKTTKSTFPIVNEDLFYDFLRGYFDGDGCVYYNNEKNILKCHITSCTSDVLYYISNILNNDGIKNRVYKETERKFRLYITGPKLNNIKFLDKIYNNSNLFLNRKFYKYLYAKATIYRNIYLKSRKIEEA